ncbi:hypothetical protein [Bacteroides caccae]|uniref:hypothetical protein n=1 Tax=Bacteroides caccae TaxID=47678 RepID=UPI00189DBA7A|nr:hypothetical protein [Bacteroides caccae]
MKNTLEKYVIDYQGCKSNPKKTLCMLYKKRRMLVVIFLTVGYYNYNMSSTCRKLSCMNNPVCDEEEMKRQKFDAILEGKRIRKDDVTNRDYWVNQSIKHYECMMFFNTGIGVFGYTLEDIMKFYKWLDHSCPKESAHLKSECEMHYQIYVRMLLAYINGDITYKEFERKFVNIDPDGCVSPVSRHDVLRFIKDMFRVYQLFQKVVNGKPTVSPVIMN